jgi:outer membrane protein OmpA-like peptidoglycan-associated protein
MQTTLRGWRIWLTIASVAALAMPGPVRAQRLPANNLVPDGGFEQFKACPTDVAELKYKSVQWSSANTGTPDLHCSCGQVGIVNTTRNLMGRQTPWQGGCYAGMFLKHGKIPAYREYIVATLTKPLAAGTWYAATVRLCRATYSGQAVNGIGLWLGEHKPTAPDNLPLAADGWVELQHPTPIVSDTTWTEVTTQYLASGNERYFVLGNFKWDGETPTAEVPGHPPAENKNIRDELHRSAYYYIDGVQLVPSEAPPPARKPREISGGELPDSIPLAAPLVLRDVTFETAQAELLPTSFNILQAVAAHLQKHPNLEVELSGHTDDRGTPEYNLQLSIDRVRAVAAYLAKHGVDPNRIVALGFGEDQPIAPNTTDAGRAANRRVEIRFFRME